MNINRKILSLNSSNETFASFILPQRRRKVLDQTFYIATKKYLFIAVGDELGGAVAGDECAEGVVVAFVKTFHAGLVDEGGEIDLARHRRDFPRSSNTLRPVLHLLRQLIRISPSQTIHLRLVNVKVERRHC